MGMTANDDIEASRSGAQIDFFNVMQNVDQYRTDLSDFSFRNSISPIAFVIVAANGNYRRNRSQLFQHFRRTDIAGMKNEINTAKRIYYFRV